ncbi:hypothetical protein ACNKHK_10300 [Shigella flexneri]
MGNLVGHGNWFCFNAGNNCLIVYFSQFSPLKKLPLGVAYALWEGIWYFIYYLV